MNLRDYISAGYFLSRHTGTEDIAGIETRRETLATDHSQREFFPNSWALSWCDASREERVRKAFVFGITEQELDGVIAWADRGFGTVFGPWSVFFGLEDARAAAHSMLGRANDLQLWGVGLHLDLLSAYCEASRPPAQQRGHAPIGEGGVHEAACTRPAPLAPGGVPLGHELLIEEDGYAFNSPESRHLEERDLFRTLGVLPNRFGLIDSFSEALACARHLESLAARTPHQITGWRPWLIVQYPLY
jgi:hypothetical protein